MLDYSCFITLPLLDVLQTCMPCAGHSNSPCELMSLIQDATKPHQTLCEDSEWKFSAGTPCHPTSQTSQSRTEKPTYCACVPESADVSLGQPEGFASEMEDIVCIDKQPPSGWGKNTCELQKAAGNCEKPWFRDHAEGRMFMC